MTDLELRMRVPRSETFQVDLALMIPSGETHALLGPNGAGKSTVVAAIAGLVSIASGRIALDGAVLDDPAGRVFVPPEERSIGVVFQDYLLFPHLNVMENVEFGLRSRHVARSEAVARSREWLRRVGLEGREDAKPGDLSGGQAQRVALARALVTDPEVLLLDEPLSALDVTTRTSLRRVLAEHLIAFEGPRLLITHDPAEAFILADTIHIIEAGTVTQTGDADDIRLRPRTPYAADVAGANLLSGTATSGLVTVGAHQLQVADEVPDGPVLVAIQPTAVAIHIRRPGGSPRNTWAATVERIERLGTRVRLQTGDPLPLTAELTVAARDDLGLEPGSEVWVAVKATEIEVQEDGADG